MRKICIGIKYAIVKRGKYFFWEFGGGRGKEFASSNNGLGGRKCG